MTDPLSVLFATAEVAPFAKVGGLADVSAALPRELSQQGIEITVISPFYRMVREQYSRMKVTGLSGEIKLGKDGFPYQIRELQSAGVRYWFVENDFYYDRSGIYTKSNGQGYTDNNARSFFFQYVILDLITKEYLSPAVIHVNDHHTALLPLMLKKRAIQIPVLLTIHNAMYQGIFSVKEAKLLHRNEMGYFHDQERNALKTGIRYANRIVTVSPTYRDELLSQADLAYGLQSELMRRNKAFIGILNGADYDYWNPETDTYLIQNYSLDTLPEKSLNKSALMKTLHLDGSLATPLFGSVSRQVESKGFHLILDMIDPLVTDGACFVFLGTGDPGIMRALKDKSQEYPASVACIQAYDEPLAHRIEAGADFFLMPSRYEPCGLNQIYSLRYGTIPIVHRTGGLADTVTDWNGTKGNGFLFEPYNSNAFLKKVREALTVFGTKDWNSLRRNAMLSDYSWRKSAQKYRSLYEALRSQYE